MADANDPLDQTPGSTPEPRENSPAAGAETVAAQETAVTADQPIPIPPPPPVPPSADEERIALLRNLTHLDWALAALVLALAFLLASFSINNPDFWLHLAAGRNIAENGLAARGAEPFSYTAEGTFWVNGNWLFDLGLYLVYSLASATGVVICKALVVVLLAVVLLQIRRPQQSLWAPAVCTILALLTMSPRLLAQPLVVSLLFLAVTLYVLFRASPDKAAPSGNRLSPLWLLPPWFALWANLDSWFFLGPLLVGLVLLGEWLQVLSVPAEAKAVADKGRLKLLAQVLPAGLLACLVNPYFYQVFTLPPEPAYLVIDMGDWLPSGMVAAGETLQEVGKSDTAFLQNLALWNSPLSYEFYWSDVRRGLNVAGMAYFVLLLLGLVCWGLVVWAKGTQNFPWARLLVWAAFALLSLIQGRLIVLFAVVAGPLTALTAQDLIRQRFGMELNTGRPWRIWSLTGRALSLVGCLVLLLLAWPGWLNARPEDPRVSHHVGWSILADESQEKAATQLGQMQQQGKLGHGFTYGPDFAAHCAWFGPQEKSFYDYRWELFPSVGRDVGALRKNLYDMGANLQAHQVTLERGRAARLDPKKMADLMAQVPLVPGSHLLTVKTQEVMRHWQIDHVILPRIDRNKSAEWMARRLLMEPEQWPLLYSDGQTVVFGWADPQQPAHAAAVRTLAVNPSRTAFGRREPESDPAADSKAFLVAEPDRWQEILEGPVAAPGDAFAARFDRIRYEIGCDRTQQIFQNVTWSSRRIGGAVLDCGAGLCSAPAGVGAVAVTVAVGCAARSDRSLPGAPDLGPPGLPLLAMQAARRAINSRPADAAGYRALAEASHILLYMQEHWWTGQSPDQVPTTRTQLRRLQWVAAMKQRARLQPDEPEVYWALYQYYLQKNYRDVAWEHLEKLHEILENAQPRPDQSQNLEQTRKEIKGLYDRFKEDVDRRRSYYDLHAAGQNMANKFAIALNSPYPPPGSKNLPKDQPPGRLGLARQALKVLQGANLAQLSKEELLVNVGWRLYLQLEIGELAEPRELLARPEVRAVPPEAWAKVIYGPRPGLVDFNAWLAAIEGDYKGFEVALRKTEQHFLKERERLLLEMKKPFLKLDQMSEAPRVLLPQLLLQTSAPPTSVPGAASQLYLWFDPVSTMAEYLGLLQFVAEQRFLRGLMALEQGNTAAAQQHFQDVRDMLNPRVDFPDRGIARRYLELLDQQRGPLPKRTK